MREPIYHVVPSQIGNGWTVLYRDEYVTQFAKRHDAMAYVRRRKRRIRYQWREAR